MTAQSTTINCSVNHEWGRLKEVCFGIPEMKIPKKLPKRLEDFMPETGIEFLKKHPGKTLQQANINLYNQALHQMEGAIEVILGKIPDLIIHRPTVLDDHEQRYIENVIPAGSTQFYPRDPMLVIGDKFIETEFFLPYRRRERFGVRKTLQPGLNVGNAELYHMPVAEPTLEDPEGNWGPGPFLEGGDVFLLGYDIYVGVSGLASNQAGIDWLANKLGPKYTVHRVDLAPDVLHLDCCLSLPRDGVAIVDKHGFKDSKIPDFISTWDLIHVPKPEAKNKMATNILVLDDENILMQVGLNTPLAQNLRNRDFDVVEVPFDAVYQFGGAFRCWHHPLVRESELPS